MSKTKMQERTKSANAVENWQMHGRADNVLFLWTLPLLLESY